MGNICLAQQNEDEDIKKIIINEKNEREKCKNKIEIFVDNEVTLLKHNINIVENVLNENLSEINIIRVNSINDIKNIEISMEKIRNDISTLRHNTASIKDNLKSIQNKLTMIYIENEKTHNWLVKKND